MDKFSNGMKIVTQSDWTNLNNSLGNASLGNGAFSNQYDSNIGLELNADTFFTQHVAEIETDYQTAIIGKSRQEDFYPYIDNLPMVVFYEDIYLKKDGVGYIVDDNDKFSEAQTTVFLSANTIVPIKPDVVTRGSIVGYSWMVSAEISDMEYDGTQLYCRVKWAPGTVFDEDAGASLYTEEYVVSGSDLWGTQFTTSDGGSLESLINDSKVNFPTTSGMADFTVLPDPILEQFLIRVPVARYDWELDQSELARCVQLPILIPGGGGGSTATVKSVFRHPFKGYILSGDIITIAPDRADSAYEFKDTVTIVDPDDDLDVQIHTGYYDAEEQISVSGNSYVYYELYKNGSDWVSTLKSTEIWPPAVKFAGLIHHQVGYAEGSNVSGNFVVSGWGQHMFECPTIHAPDLRGDFEPWYEMSGFVTLAPGEVETIYGDGMAFSASTWPLTGDYDIYMEAESFHTAGDASVTFNTDLISGTYVGYFEKLPNLNEKYRWLIGQVKTLGAETVYRPMNKGKVVVDTTLLNPNMMENFCISVDSPRLMEFADDQPTSVGYSNNPVLLSGMTFDYRTRGGTIKGMPEDANVEFHGMTSADYFDVIGYSGVDGADWGQGSMVISGVELDFEFDRGLGQKFDHSDNINVTINAGDNVRIDYAAGIATINAKFEAVTGLNIDKNEQLISVAGSDGAYYGEGSMTVSGTAFDREFVDGRAIRNDINAGNVFSIIAGENIRIDYAANVATINAPPSGTFQTLSADFTQITVVSDAQLLSGGTLQIKTRTAYVYNPGVESGWTNAGSLGTIPCSGV